MKKLIFLSISAIIVLAGCKGSAFLNQRYTKLGHSAQKESKEEKVLVNRAKKMSIVTNESPKNNETEEVLIASTLLKENRLMFQSRIEKNKLINSFGSNSNLIDTKNASVLKSETKNYKAKKTAHKKSIATKGLIGGVLGIVLTIVVIVAVVFLVLFLLIL